MKAKILQSLTKMCVSKLEATGLNVVALICDQGSNNRSFLQGLEIVSVNQPYIRHNDKIIFVFYDPPHLLKNIRKKRDFYVDGKLVSWQHIVDFYHFDKSHEIQLVPKLTDKHINLPPFTLMHVNLAAQVLSHSVAAGISFLVRAGIMPESAKAAAQFVEYFDVLFNTFNSQTIKPSKTLQNAFNDTSGHQAFLQESLNLLSNITTNSSVELPCVTGWQTSINALLGLWQYLKSRQNFQFILTRRLNQDCAENLFSIIRG